MDRDDQNRTEMFSTVDGLMDQNNSIWSVVPAINETTADFKVIIADVGESIRKQATATGGAGDEKTNVRLSFEEKILEIADQLSALAAKNNDVNLGAQVEWSLSALDKMGVDDLEALGKTVSGLATANLAALAAYGITAADVAALDGLTARFHSESVWKLGLAASSSFSSSSSSSKTLVRSRTRTRTTTRTNG
jgi:hypothetical protein